MMRGSLFVVSALLAGCTVDLASTSEDITVAASDTFVAAVAVPNAVVRISTPIDLTGFQRIPVAPGVQILGSGGAMLFTDSFPSSFLLLGDHVRISGVRVRGGESDDPFSAVDQTDSNGLQIESSLNVEIDRCEVDHWRGAAIAVLDNGGRLDLAHADSVWIHDNFIHHNQHPTADSIIPSGGHGAGYGVQMSHGAYARVEANVFDYNRHNIMGDGSAGTGYLFYRNLILPHGGINSREVGFTIHTHAIDMHGSDTCGLLGGDHNCGLAGEYMDIQYNTVLYTDGDSVKLRGTPSLRMNVANNVFAGDDDSLVQNETGMQTANNAFDLDTTSEERACDFDGDGIADPFLATGVTWWYAASTKAGRWTYLANTTVRAAQVSLGDQNGDGRCDVVSAGTVLYMSDSGLAPAAPVSHGSGLAAARNPDGSVALFGANGASVLRRDAIGGPWTAFDGILSAVASAENADGRIELFGVNAGGGIFHRAQLAPGSDSWSPWSQLDGLLVSIAVARNADGRLELIGTNSAGNVWHRRQTVANGSAWSAWQALDGTFTTVAAATNADGRVEVFALSTTGQIFHRAELAASGTTWSAWTSLDGLLTQMTVARDIDGRLVLFGTNRYGTVWRRSQASAGAASWSAWSGLDDGTLRSTALAAEVDATGTMQLFGVDRKGALVHRGTGGWSHLPGGLFNAVPEVRGMTGAAAVAALNVAGYSVVTQTYLDASCSMAPGFVVIQDAPVGPAARENGAPLLPITIWVSALPNPSECNG